MSNNEKLLSDDFHALDEQQLKARKLMLEIESLRRALRPQALPFWTRINNYFQNNVGQIVTIVALFGSLIIPTWNFISGYRQEKLVEINNVILDTILNPKAEIDEAYLMKIGTQDPSVVAPILFDQLNGRKITSRKTLKVFDRMYSVNKDIVRYSWTDHILFLFFSDNKEVLEDELCLNALRHFEELDQIEVTKDYIDIIKAMKFTDKPDFQDAFSVLSSACAKSTEYEFLCSYLIDKPHEPN